MSKQAEIDKLQEENNALKEDNFLLQEENKALKEDNFLLQEENKALKGELDHPSSLSEQPKTIKIGEKTYEIVTPVVRIANRLVPIQNCEENLLKDLTENPNFLKKI